jgi:hypothetical protein
MRLFFAGLFILGGVLGEFFIVEWINPQLNPFELRFSIPLIVGLIVGAKFLFNERNPWVKRNGVLTYRRRDELVSDTYRAGRALELRVPDTNEGWYLIELDTGKVLCLWDNLPSGPLGFDSMNPEVRRFPCTEFAVLRHPTENFTAEIDCGSRLIKPITIVLPDHYDEWLHTYIPKDGDLIPDKTFDEVRADVVKACGGRDNSENSPAAW